jgi:hypothetical protein
VLLQFAPSYSDYVLYSDGGPADNVKRKKYRGQKGTASSKQGDHMFRTYSSALQVTEAHQFHVVFRSTVS